MRYRWRLTERIRITEENKLGTRHLTAVVVNSRYKIAQYGQWDGYPDGAGVGVLKFLTGLAGNFAEFRRKVWKTRKFTNKVLREYAESNGVELVKDRRGNIDIPHSSYEKFFEKFPQMSRNMGNEVLDHVLQSEAGTYLSHQMRFAADSLFCEWLWLIDLDRMTFEGFKGFNKTPLGPGDRFFFLQQLEEKEGKMEKKPDFPDEDAYYYPVRLMKEWKLAALPTQEEFLAAFETDEEEE